MPRLVIQQTAEAARQNPGVADQSDARATELQSSLTAHDQGLLSLRAQKSELQRQINALAPDALLRGELNGRMLRLDAQIVEQQMQIAGTKAQLASPQGVPVVGQPPSSPPGIPGSPPWIDPDVFNGLVVFLTVAIVAPISIGLLRRLWRRPQKDQKDPVTPIADKLFARLDRMEQAIDAIAIEVERVSEGQRFMAKTLAERPAPSIRSAAPQVNEGLATDDAAPFLALGAGPIEPIRMAERQAVRQSITPH